MISNANDSSLIICDEIIENGTILNDIDSFDSLLDTLNERRKNILSGGTNCIPFPFKRFAGDIPGVEQGQYVIVTASQKTGKTQISDFLYVFNVLDYAFEYPDRCSVHIIYFALEESIQKILLRYMSYLLWKLDNIRISPTDLKSTSREFPVSEEILNKFTEKKYMDRLQFFRDCVQFDTENTNPTGILRTCEAYAKEVGEYKCHKELSGNLSKEVTVFDSYEQNDPNHYKIMIVDHIGLVDKEQGFRTKDSVDKISEYCVKYLRNRFNYTCVCIQQQASEVEGLEAIKQKKMLPSTASLSDSKYTARDADLVLGLFDPSKFGLPAWLGYTIQDPENNGLKNYARFLYVLANRNGEMGGVCPLYFDGAACWFEELPLPDDADHIMDYYRRVKNIKSYRQQRKALDIIMTFLSKLKYNV